jgi:hypothetical protein
MNRIRFQLVTGMLALAASAYASGIIVDNDEWTLSNAGFASEGTTNGTNYAKNAAMFLTGASGGDKIWIDSDDFGLDGTDLSSALSAYTLTDTGFSAFTLPELEGYSAVFLAGDTLTLAEETALINYVNTGGSVYVAAGTDQIPGGAAGEAAQWNAFLNTFSLSLASGFNSVVGNFPTTSSGPVLSGVTQLYYNNGNSVSATTSSAQIIATASRQGMIGMYIEKFSETAVVPEPPTGLLAGISVAGLGLYRRKRVTP